MSLFALIGGIWLSLLYSSAVVPATVWIVQITVSRGWLTGLGTGIAMSLGQIPWCLAASLLLFQYPETWQNADPYLRVAGVAFLFWMAHRTTRAGELIFLRLETDLPPRELLRASFQRSLTMPWRLPLWASLVVSIGIHLRGPGMAAALLFTIGAFFGQLAWFILFTVVAGIFGHRVPEDISLRSLNKLRFLATIVLAGLGLIILAPLAFPPN